MKENRILERWFFYQDAASLWRWARLDVLGSVLGYSAAAFDSREACVGDARRLGYREEAAARSGLPNVRLEGDDRPDPGLTHAV
jgi:hypothetical protein